MSIENPTCRYPWCPKPFGHEDDCVFANKNETIKHPPHYLKHPSGVECITIVQHMGFNIGNAVKYLWRAGLKGDAIEDLRKARQYIDFELVRLTKGVKS